MRTITLQQSMSTLDLSNHSLRDSVLRVARTPHSPLLATMVGCNALEKVYSPLA